jgi:hypothetical protein
MRDQSAYIGRMTPAAAWQASYARRCELTDRCLHHIGQNPYDSSPIRYISSLLTTIAFFEESWETKDHQNRGLSRVHPSPDLGLAAIPALGI